VTKVVDHAALAADGFFVTAPLLDRSSVDRLIQLLGEPGEGGGSRGAYAARNLLIRFPEVRAIARSEALTAVVEPLLGGGWRCVRGILFDKTAAANWKVAWHQDLSIAVKQRVDVQGFGPWSVKAGVQHVQPPSGVLEGMLTIRLHLDDCGVENGPLKVLPGSHAHGVLCPEALERWCRCREPHVCLAPAGAALVMRPLLVHASSSATRPGHRRVIHLEFAASDLPSGMEWAVAPG
jgi:ectoine hydroxylase-related dioxygenase (phytanoyl-CoA dioxygenase family)